MKIAVFFIEGLELHYDHEEVEAIPVPLRVLDRASAVTMLAKQLSWVAAEVERLLAAGADDQVAVWIERAARAAERLRHAWNEEHAQGGAGYGPRQTSPSGCST